ncbi:MAG: integrase arm-type DNA-binding domain-containing protein [Rhodovulum sp.]|nr:integrase arm-type DNA-binding domain-containing protein [Rhodovulum sp.]
MPKLTKSIVDAAELKDGPYFIWCSELPGFGVRVFPSGKRVYYADYRNKAGVRKRMSLGPHGKLTTEAARKLAVITLGGVLKGEDPAEERSTRRNSLTTADQHIITIPGPIIDEDVIEAKVRELCVDYAVREIAFDPKFATKLMARLVDDGLPVVEHPQSSLHFTEGITEFQRAIIGRRLRHGGHPVLRWCVGNVAPVTTDTGLVRFSKSRSADAIDCAVAAAMAIGRAAKGDGGCVYDDAEARPEGLLFV